MPEEKLLGVRVFHEVKRVSTIPEMHPISAPLNSVWAQVWTDSRLVLFFFAGDSLFIQTLLSHWSN